MSKHTKGPWKVGYFSNVDVKGKYLSVWPADIKDGEVGDCVCLVSPVEKTRDHDRANANLIAAAPELLEALVVCWNSLKTYGDHWLIERKVNAVLDKVKGKKEETSHE